MASGLFFFFFFWFNNQTYIFVCRSPRLWPLAGLCLVFHNDDLWSQQSGNWFWNLDPKQTNHWCLFVLSTNLFKRRRRRKKKTLNSFLECHTKTVHETFLLFPSEPQKCFNDTMKHIILTNNIMFYIFKTSEYQRFIFSPVCVCVCVYCIHLLHFFQWVGLRATAWCHRYWLLCTFLGGKCPQQWFAGSDLNWALFTQHCRFNCWHDARDISWIFSSALVPWSAPW